MKIDELWTDVDGRDHGLIWHPVPSSERRKGIIEVYVGCTVTTQNLDTWLTEHEAGIPTS